MNKETTTMSGNVARKTPLEQFFADEASRVSCSAAMRRMMDSVPGSYAAALATIDGKPVVHATAADWRQARVAAIVGSLCALGETLAKEVNQRTCRNVLIETENGLTVVQRLPSPAERLILLTTSNREANLGVLLTYSRTCAAAIARLVTPQAPR